MIVAPPKETEAGAVETTGHTTASQRLGIVLRGHALTG
jgi:hypothetical protein